MARKEDAPRIDPIRAAALAALELAADKPWDHVSIHAIARKAEIGLDDLYDMGGKGAVLAEIDRVFDRAMGVGLEPLDEEADENVRRERLMDVMMQRFEAMEQHRAAVTSIHDYITSNPAEAAKGAARRHKTASWALEASQLEDPAGTRSLALATSFMRMKGVWLSDEAPLDRTLAAIDKDLRSYSDWMDDISDVADKVKDFFMGLGDTISGEVNKRRARRDDDVEDADDIDDGDGKDAPGGKSAPGAPPPPL